MKTHVIIAGLMMLMLGLLVGCTLIMKVTAQFVNIDSDDPELELNFTFSTFKNRPTGIHSIEIYTGDSLVCTLGQSDTQENPEGLSEWAFPSIPKGFSLLYPKGATALPTFLKTNPLNFHFQGAGHGSWEYKPSYYRTENRWQFDEVGNQIFDITCQYEPWIGKDMVRIQLSEVIEVHEESFQLVLPSGKGVPFRLVYKKSPTDILALTLEKGIPTGETLHLSFEIESGKPIRQFIQVPAKDQIGLVGKYHGL